MRRGGTFLPEFGALPDAETVLFVDDSQSETGELNAVFNQGVGADENVYLSGNEVGEQGLPLFAFNNSGEQLGTHAAAGEHLADGDKMLLSEDFGGGHQAGLKSVVYGNEHRHEGDEGFARTNIALQEPVHLMTAVHVAAYLVHDAFLGSGEFER